VRKNFWRFVPLLTLAFVVNYLDRICIGFAALSMNRDLNITPIQFGLASGILFLGYCMFEVPSNLALYKFGARRWLARIMITWGIVAAANAFVTGPTSLYISRFALGAAEAGFFPGAAFLLSVWFPAQYRARALAWLSAAVPISSVIGGPISALLMQSTHGAFGLVGWQWMFIIEGLPACVLGIVIFFLITDAPRDARWLTQEEHTALLTALEGEKKREVRTSFKEAVLDRRVIILTGVQFGFVLGAYGVGLWLPQILRQFTLSIMTIGLLSTVPYVFATVGMLLWARHADQSGRLLGNLTASCVVAVAGLLVSVIGQSLLPALIGLTIAMVGVTSARGMFWAIPATFLSGAGAAGGLAFINSVGALGGFVGPSIMGWLREETGSFKTGILVMGGILLVSGLLSLTLSRRRKSS
ncbi:MFS transporter, partial [Caballeronia sp. BR00000012568055]|uniref:MFS transporter n=1 Tax=Caballeronia sp. BR00000012568055 TaxID=2918761 RepID=UPI0027D31A16